MTTLIKQRNPTDCMICCIAMALGLPYDDVFDIATTDLNQFKECVDEEYAITGIYSVINERVAVHNKGSKFVIYDEANGYRGLTDYDATCLLEALGQKDEYRVIHKPDILTDDFFKKQIWGRPAILCVPSLNNPGGYHAIYYDGTDIYDPSRKKTYDNFESTKPYRFTMFRNIRPVKQLTKME